MAIRRKGWFWTGVGLLMGSGVWWFFFASGMVSNEPSVPLLSIPAAILTLIGVFCLRRSSKAPTLEAGLAPESVYQIQANTQPTEQVQRVVEEAYKRALKDLHPAFQHNYYLFRRKVFTLFGSAVHVYDKLGNPLFYSKQKAFRLDFHVYSGEYQAQELLTIKMTKNKNILDFGLACNVQDSTTGEPIGSVRRKGLKWIFLSNEGQEVGRLAQSGFLTQNYVITSTDGREVANIKRHSSTFVLKYSMTIAEPVSSIDRRLLISMGILLVSITRY